MQDKVSTYNGGTRTCKQEGNTVGSLTKRQKSIVIGCLLGDGAMRCKNNALLEINHSFKQRAYVDWKYQQLRRLVATPPKKRFGRNGRIAYRFTTLSIPALTKIYKKFYLNGQKRIPDGLRLTNLSLAVWFMDDGCRSRRAAYFNTQKFSMIEQRRLIRLLRAKGITADINRDKKYWRLRVAVASMKRLKGLIQPYILPSLRYKLPS